MGWLAQQSQHTHIIVELINEMLSLEKQITC
jgi:hypothetical protein